MSYSQNEADLLSEVERLRGALADVLHRFVEASVDEAGKRAKPVLRTGWIPEETLDRWQRALAGTHAPSGVPDDAPPRPDQEPPAATTPTDCADLRYDDCEP